MVCASVAEIYFKLHWTRAHSKVSSQHKASLSKFFSLSTEWEAEYFCLIILTFPLSETEKETLCCLVARIALWHWSISLQHLLLLGTSVWHGKKRKKPINDKINQAKPWHSRLHKAPTSSYASALPQAWLFALNFRANESNPRNATGHCLVMLMTPPSPLQAPLFQELTVKGRWLSLQLQSHSDTDKVS